MPDDVHDYYITVTFKVPSPYGPGETVARFQRDIDYIIRNYDEELLPNIVPILITSKGYPPDV